MNNVEKAYLSELLDGLDLVLKPGDKSYDLLCAPDTDTVFARVGEGKFSIMDETPEEMEYVLREMIHDAYDFSRQFEAAEEMDSYGVEGYRRIGEFGATVLAAKQSGSGRMEYVVWSYEAMRKGVVHGDYYNKLEPAKKGFLIRSGAIPVGHVILMKEQLSNIQNIDDMSQEELEKLELAECEQDLDDGMEH